MRRRREAGLTYSPPPYGMRAESGHLVPDEHEQETIAIARRLRTHGMALRAVVSTLAELGRFSRSGRPFAPSAVAAMCRESDTPGV